MVVVEEEATSAIVPGRKKKSLHYSFAIIWVHFPLSITAGVLVAISL